MRIEVSVRRWVEVKAPLFRSLLLMLFPRFHDRVTPQANVTHVLG
jgi:hypothetical protein